MLELSIKSSFSTNDFITFFVELMELKEEFLLKENLQRLNIIVASQCL
ncbi:MAG: hypothetical protein HZA00_07715 [Nitrospinae bacterium]|nr:hypothetical protein [Nitrospinota bacterium]